MDFWGTILVLVRRWYVSLPAFLLALGGAFYAYTTIPVTYTTTAVLVLTAPTSGGGVLAPDPGQPMPKVNPLLNFAHGLDVAASMLISGMSTPDMVAEMGTAEGDTAYKVTNGTNNLESLATGPLVFVEGESRTPEASSVIVRQVIARIRQELDVRQRQVHAPPETYITISEAVPPTTPAPQRGRNLRSAAAALGLGMIAALTAAFAVESMAGHRLRRREPGRPKELVAAEQTGP